MDDDSTLDNDTANELAEMLDAPYREYWAELGRFIHVFSSVESTIQSLVHHCASVDDTIGKAIFHGLRIDNAKDAINRLLEARGDLATIARLADPFSQLSLIANVRNNLVHWGARDTSAGLLVSNAHVAFTASRLKRYVISAYTLTEMRADLHKIDIHLLAEIWRDTPKQVPSGFMQKVVEPIVAASSSYKPPQQSPAKKPSGTRAARRERRRQQGASEA